MHPAEATLNPREPFLRHCSWLVPLDASQVNKKAVFALHYKDNSPSRPFPY